MCQAETGSGWDIGAIMSTAWASSSPSSGQYRSPVRSMAGPYHGVPGKGSAFEAVFEAAEALNVRVCVLLDRDLRSITPDWIEMLGGPIILKGYDYGSPYQGG